MCFIFMSGEQIPNYIVKGRGEQPPCITLWLVWIAIGGFTYIDLVIWKVKDDWPITTTIIGQHQCVVYSNVFYHYSVKNVLCYSHFINYNQIVGMGGITKYSLPSNILFHANHLRGQGKMKQCQIKRDSWKVYKVANL